MYPRDEQYRQLWAEMETFLQTTSSTSKMHARVYNYLRGDPENDEENSNDSISTQNESMCYVLTLRGGPLDFRGGGLEELLSEGN